ncbi:hypothetical protein [Chryseobacterium koreense]|uniref:Uncharacterized protein n=1 Tax=Chryseobacterium koreense CCUG 49689 TaxID=1304281 RepID=A0A0J7J1S4_9FLAO|nr:hypothetical protein [Chryseobacterium koreense]KMQ72207.1 hypothetical protein ACM44_04170 [Chryseobacterium koreense CCUG 49689]MBB5334621.1 putative membrane protein [Chryseobacterium koreense]
MNSKKKKIIIAALIILATLNALAFYILKEGIAISDALEHVENDAMGKSLKQKQILSDVLPSLVFTIDIALIFFGCYLLIKMLFKSLKKSTSSQS